MTLSVTALGDTKFSDATVYSSTLLLSCLFSSVQTRCLQVPIQSSALFRLDHRFEFCLFGWRSV